MKKKEEAPRTQKAPYVPPTIEKQQLVEEVLGQSTAPATTPGGRPL